jgi:hypothetical protein
VHERDFGIDHFQRMADVLRAAAPQIIAAVVDAELVARSGWARAARRSSRCSRRR